MTATKKTTTVNATKKAAKAKTTKAAKTPTPATEAKTRKLSALDAAAKVLGEAGAPMGCKEMIEAMAAKGYWSSPGGKTPHATLYAAVLRETQTKGKGQGGPLREDRARQVHPGPTASEEVPMTTNHHPSDDHDYERVTPSSACPECGEDDIDALVWIDDDRVQCASCDNIYEPGRREDE